LVSFYLESETGDYNDFTGVLGGSSASLEITQDAGIRMKKPVQVQEEEWYERYVVLTLNPYPYRCRPFRERILCRVT